MTVNIFYSRQSDADCMLPCLWIEFQSHSLITLFYKSLSACKMPFPFATLPYMLQNCCSPTTVTYCYVLYIWWQKIDGCNKMTCTKCHTFFCWLCKLVLPRANPYIHYRNNPKCHLFPGERDIDDVAFEVDFEDVFWRRPPSLYSILSRKYILIFC